MNILKLEAIMTIKNILVYLVTVVCTLSLSSCKESVPGYFDDITGVYFDNRTAVGVLTDSVSVTFAYEKEDFMEVPVKIRLVGRPSETARPVSVTASSDNAQEGMDYSLPQNAEIPAGAVETDYIIRLTKTEELNTMEKSIILKLHANDEFDLPFPGEKNPAGEMVTALEFRIFFSNIFNKAPVAWETDILGPFSREKFELACKHLDIDPADFNDPTKMTLPRSMFVSKEMNSYVKEQVENKNAGRPYDKEAFDSKGQPLNFGNN